jgi:flagellar hook-associated protein 2
MTSPSSFNVSGLLGGVAGSIDTTTLISQMMQAQALPQTMLKNQLSAQQTALSAYQAVNTTVTAVQTAAHAFTDVLSSVWQSTAASSSNAAVVATSSSTAQAGTTIFNVVGLAAAQVTTVKAATDGTVVTTPSNGITITGADGTAHAISLTSGSAADVAAAINSAAVGVRASVVNVDDGTGTGSTIPLLQLNATATGTKAGFTVSGFDDTAPATITQAANAQVGVGDPAAGGYTVSSQSNTFTDMIPGVTFSVNAIVSNVAVTVKTDNGAISDKVQALVDAVNSAANTIGQTTAKGAVLQGSYDVTSLQQSLYAAVSKGGPGGTSLHTYGIDMDSTGKLSFDATAFAAAFTKDPTGTQAAVNDFATSLDTVSTGAIDPTTGNITAAITSANGQITDLNTRINDWTPRLALIQTGLQQKFNAMQTALAKLQSQSSYLTSMLKSMSSGSSSSSSS